MVRTRSPRPSRCAVVVRRPLPAGGPTGGHRRAVTAAVRALPRRRREGREGDEGMTTAEYAVGTVAACGFAGVLWAVLHSSIVRQMLESVIHRALTIAF